MTETAAGLAERLRELGFDRRATLHEIHPDLRHVEVRRRCRGSSATHRTLLHVETSRGPTPAQMNGLVDHARHLDALEGPADYVEASRRVYDEARRLLGIADDPGYEFVPHNPWSNRPAIRVRIAEGQRESDPFPLHATFSILDPDDPLPGVRRVAAEIRRRRDECAKEAARQAASTRIVERSAAVILAHVLKDEEEVVAALSSPAAWPRITHAIDEKITTKQDQLSTDVAGAPSIAVRVSSNLAWLTTRGPLSGGFAWNGTSLLSYEGAGLSDTLLTAIVGCRLEQVVDHPWVRGIDARIVRATVKGKGGHARLALATAKDRVPLDEARATARRIIAEHHR